MRSPFNLPRSGLLPSVITMLAILTGNAAADTNVPGLLQICAPGVYFNNLQTSDAIENWDQRVIGDSYAVTTLGLESACALQNWSGPLGNDLSHPQAVVGSAFPNVVGISSAATPITFNVSGADLAGPFDLGMPPCMPGNSKIDGCVVNNGTNIVYRLANGAGEFTGKWTAANASTNSYFQFDRSGLCSSPLQTIVHPSQGVPCSYQLTFNLNTDGIPNLQKSMQVVFLTGGGGGGVVEMPSFPGSFGYAHTFGVAIPMLFTAGSSTSIAASVSPAVVGVGKQSTVSGQFNGALIPSSLPTLALQSRAMGTSTFSQSAQAPTDSDGEVSFKVKPKVNTDYRLQQVGTAAGAFVVSNIVNVSVSRSVSFSATLSKKSITKNRKKVTTVTASFKGQITPGSNAKSVIIQRLIGSVWTKFATFKPSGSGSYSGKATLPSGKFGYRATVNGSNAYATSSSAAKKLGG